MLQEDPSASEYCRLQSVTQALTQLFCRTSIIHLVLMSGERYLAINHPFVYNNFVCSGSRILSASAVAWIVSILLQIPAFVNKELFFLINNSLLLPYMAFIIFCQGANYCEARRQAKLIAPYQVSEVTKQRFLKDKRALKITTAVILASVFGYFPIFSIRVILLNFRRYISVNVA